MLQFFFKLLYRINIDTANILQSKKMEENTTNDQSNDALSSLADLSVLLAASSNTSLTSAAVEKIPLADEKVEGGEMKRARSISNSSFVVELDAGERYQGVYISIYYFIYIKYDFIRISALEKIMTNHHHQNKYLTDFPKEKGRWKAQRALKTMNQNIVMWNINLSHHQM